MSLGNICFLTSVHPATDVRIFYKEAVTLSQSGYKVTIIGQYPKNEIINNVNVIALKKPKNRFSRILFLHLNLYRLAKNQKADIYHIHDPELLLLALILKNQTNSKIIYDVHEDVPEQILDKQWIPKVIRKIASIIFNYFEKQTSNYFDYIITATPHIRSKFSNIKCIDIKNYPLLANFPDYTNHEFPKTPNIFRIIYIGQLEYIRGIQNIIYAVNSLDSSYSLELILAGIFDNEKFEFHLKHMDGWDKVNYLGWLPYHSIYNELVKADIGIICLLPIGRFQTSLPLKMFEYMAANLPIIVSNFPLWKDIINPNNCGLAVDPTNCREIAHAIQTLIDHPEQTKKMGENCRKAVIEKYNWELESKRLIDTYKEVLN
jgi:glycosyltransferase involved in cell wall biosynthesis